MSPKARFLSNLALNKQAIPKPLHHIAPILRKSIFIVLLFLLLPVSLAAHQNILASHQKDSLWSVVKSYYHTQSEKIARSQTDSLICGICQEKIECQWDIYITLIDHFEEEFKLKEAIGLELTLMKLVKQAGKLEKEADVHLNIHRFYDALGFRQVATAHLDTAILLYQKTKNHTGLIRSTSFRLMNSQDFLTPSSVLENYQKLIADCDSINNTKLAINLRVELLDFCLRKGLLEEAQRNLKILDQIPVSQPPNKRDFFLMRSRYSAWSNYFLQKGDTALGENMLLKSFQVAVEQPDPWHIVYTLRNLAELNLAKGIISEAETYLSRAKLKAQSFNQLDQLAHIYLLEVSIAEKQKNYRRALKALKKHNDYRLTQEAKQAGFDMQNHYLKLDKEALATEAKQKALALKLSTTRFRAILIISLLIFAFAVGLSFAYVRQRKVQKALSKQNKINEKQAKELKRTDALKAQFFTNISHELRTPLTLLSSPLRKLLQEGELSEKQMRLVETANNSVQQLSILVNQVLDFRKLETDLQAVHLKQTNLHSFLSATFQQFSSLAEQKKIKYHFYINLNKKLKAEIDPIKTQQILNNLIINALKFTAPTGELRIEAELKENKSLYFQISDTGCGIDPNDLPRIFDRFFQSSNPKKELAGGSGIGLAICKEYCEILGGSIAVQSELKKGSTFYLEIPIKQVDTSLSPKTKYAVASQNKPVISKSKNGSKEEKPEILVVEDNQELQKYIRLLLEDEYTVHTAENGQIALQDLENSPNTQLIISDLMMPIMNGYSFVEKVKNQKNTQNIPVIILSARTELESKLKALRFGIDDYITKPFHENELLARIRNLIENYKVRTSVDENTNSSPSKENVHPVSESDQHWLDGFETYIHKRLSNQNLTIPDIAYDFAMSESSLLRKLKVLVGMAPLQYLREARLDLARKKLEQGEVASIKELLPQIGFINASTFSRSFSKRYGKRPSEYLKESDDF